MTRGRPAPGGPRPAAAPGPRKGPVPGPRGGEGAQRQARRPTVWLFDLDDTLHDASAASMPGIHDAMGAYIETHLGLDASDPAFWSRGLGVIAGFIDELEKLG